MTLILAPLVLASGSASRKTLLAAAGVDFIADPADLDEDRLMRDLADQDAPTVARRLAEEKALHVSRRHAGRIVLGGDSVIAFEGRHISKCATMAEARALLSALKGRDHLLVSAAALARDGVLLWAHASPCHMGMREFSPEFLDDYLAACGPTILSSVGCYHYEGRGSQLFAKVDGDYFSVLGLPLLAVLAALRQQGVLQS